MQFSKFLVTRLHYKFSNKNLINTYIIYKLIKKCQKAYRKLKPTLYLKQRLKPDREKQSK